MLTLYGSTTSPYARRIRILLADIEHEFVNMEIFSGKDREKLMEKNPTLKVPMLEDGDTVIYDSRVIFRYLCEKNGWLGLSWRQENLLTVIDSINDSLVQLLLLQRSEIESEDDKLYYRLHNERIKLAFPYLEDALINGEFHDWGYPEICLYTLADWAAFRQLHDLADYPRLLEFLSEHKSKIAVTSTDPRD